MTHSACKQTDNPFFILQLLILLGLWGCGADTSKNDSEVIRPVKFSEAEILTLEDPGCDPSELSGQMGSETLIWIADSQGKIRQQKFNMSEFSAAGLRNLYIEAAYWHDGLEIIDSGKNVSSLESILPDHLPKKNHKQLKASSSGKMLRMIGFCKPNGGYKRNSLENAALGMAVGIQNANHFSTTNTNNRAVELPKIALIVQLKILLPEDEWKDPFVPEYLADNASWFEGKGSEKMFFISSFPQSHSFINTYQYRYWEIPSIFGHEYGHHIFNQIMKMKPKNYIESRMVSALNEGFSDLSSWLGLQNSQDLYPQLITDSPLNKTRNPDFDSIVLENHDPSTIELSQRTFQKKIDKNFVAFYTTAGPQSGWANPLEKSVRRDVHLSGTVWAHIFWTLSLSVNPKLDPVKIQEMNLRWIQGVESLRLRSASYPTQPLAWLNMYMSEMVSVIWSIVPTHLRKEKARTFLLHLQQLIPGLYKDLELPETLEALRSTELN